MRAVIKQNIKVRPVKKTEQELEEERNQIFELPRKSCHQMCTALIRFKDLSPSQQQHTLHIWKRLIRIARYRKADEKLSYLIDLDASDAIVPHGEVSKRIYEEIFHSRDFSLYAQPMKKILHPPRKHLEMQALAGRLGIQFTQEVDKSMIEVVVKNSEDSDSEGEGKARKPRLKSEPWRIGQVSVYHPPVGLSQNPSQPSKSLGNEIYFSYDGEWKNGKMHGRGRYLFKDGTTYEGYFDSNKQHGEGIAEYLKGQRYEGQWAEGRWSGKGSFDSPKGTEYIGEFFRGRRHGKGKIVYPSGLTYEGEFFDGKPHGRGAVTSRLTGWSYEGSFDRYMYIRICTYVHIYMYVYV